MQNEQAIRKAVAKIEKAHTTILKLLCGIHPQRQYAFVPGADFYVIEEQLDIIAQKVKTLKVIIAPPSLCDKPMTKQTLPADMEELELQTPTRRWKREAPTSSAYDH
jgi:hypothetical protein